MIGTFKVTIILNIWIELRFLEACPNNVIGIFRTSKLANPDIQYFLTILFKLDLSDWHCFILKNYSCIYSFYEVLLFHFFCCKLFRTLHPGLMVSTSKPNHSAPKYVSELHKLYKIYFSSRLPFNQNNYGSYWTTELRS